jgi:transposase
MILHHFQHQYQFRSSRLRRTLQAANSLRKWLKQRKVKAVVPSTASRRTPYPLDSRAHKRRNLIERMFCKLKNWRRIATRYDRYAQNYLSGLALAAIMIAWI